MDEPNSSLPVSDAAHEPPPNADAAPSITPSSSAASSREDALKSLDPRHVTVERISGWIFFTIISVFGFFGCLFVVVANWPPGWGTGWILAAAFLILAGIAWSAHMWPVISYRWYRYVADTEGLEIRRGVIWRSIVNVPRSRIQHTDVRQGPLQRRFGLGTLVVHTAGTQHAEIELDGVSREDAFALRDLLTSNEEDDDAT